MSRSVRIVGLFATAIGLLATLGCDANKIGAVCASTDDCESDSACVYKITDGCASKRTCQKTPSSPRCHLIVFYCGCDGTDVAVDCSQPGGYASAAVTTLKTGSTCRPPSNDASAE